MIQVTVWCHLELTDSLTQESLLIHCMYPELSVLYNVLLSIWLSGALKNI